MGNLTTITLFMVIINLLMWFSALAIVDLNPEMEGSVCYQKSGSIIDKEIHYNNNMTTLTDSIGDDLPRAEGSVNAGSTNIFTDIFNNILGWVKSAPGIKYAYAVIAAPMNILTCLNMPSEYSVGLGVLWYVTSLVVLLAFLWGRE